MPIPVTIYHTFFPNSGDFILEKFRAEQRASMFLQATSMATERNKDLWEKRAKSNVVPLEFSLKLKPLEEFNVIQCTIFSVKRVKRLFAHF